MRLLTLHARGRQAGPVACGLLGVAAGLWTLALLVDEPGMLIGVLGSLCVVSLAGFALGGADPQLERITPRRWPRWRAAELGVAAVAAALALMPAWLATGEHVTPVLRNLAGLGGLTALGVVCLGARLAWLPPTTCAFAGAAIGPRDEPWLAVLTWPVQLDATGPALVVAAVLAVSGAVLHTRYGAATATPSVA